MLKSNLFYKHEDRLLASYAMKSSKSRGRAHKEKEHAYRPIYQRDRERIIHATAFRRLEYKTQVFVNHEGDHYRTRLTHTLEVAQLARSMARALRLNEDLAESIALAHDLGHTPFGHSGEESLSYIMRERGGFNHNTHGLRVVDCLEKRYPDFDGLNLTWEVREGIIKHTTSYDVPQVPKDLEPDMPATLETQVVNVADEIAYDSHDLDDGLSCHILHEKELKKILLWKQTADKIGKQHHRLSKQVYRFQIIKEIINKQVGDLITATESRLKKYKIKSLTDVRKAEIALVAFSASVQKNREQLRSFLYENMYKHYRVVRMANKARRFIKDLFNVYVSAPEQLPTGFQKRLKTDGPHRVVCDYIAGMTDRFALNEYKKLFEPYERV